VNFGPVLKRLREQSQLSLREVERRSGVSPSFLSLLERGERTGMSIDYLCKLCRCYSVSVDAVVKAAQNEGDRDPWEIAFDDFCEHWQPSGPAPGAAFRRDLVDLLHLVRQDERSAP
jgi:transcriptional regulator with XRE-family HTH domain